MSLVFGLTLSIIPISRMLRGRRIVINYTGDEIEDYNKLIEIVGKDNAEEHIKDVIKKYLL